MSLPKLLVADNAHNLYDVPGLSAAGQAGAYRCVLEPDDLIPLPYGSELFVLPQRKPVAFDNDSASFVTVDHIPGVSSQNPQAVAAFISPGYLVTHTASYEHNKTAPQLPLFSYASIAWFKGKIYAAAMRVDRSLRQDIRRMPVNVVKKNIKKVTKLFPKNRLIKQLTACALTYGCPAAKNFFLYREEAPLPASPRCNARCLGCLSWKPAGDCSVTQPRLIVTPSAEEIAEVALFHIARVRRAVVSFGQGCEGEPLLVGKTLVQAVKRIRQKTSRGTINLNTNASRPDIVQQLCEAGLTSMRVSLNSARAPFYEAYYRPRGYDLNTVKQSIKCAKKCGVYVSINYLSIPGFTDTPTEVQALEKFIHTMKIDMIQWRNLNIDPQLYFSAMRSRRKDLGEPLRMRTVLDRVQKRFPRLKYGYFNPYIQRIRGEGASPKK